MCANVEIKINTLHIHKIKASFIVYILDTVIKISNIVSDNRWKWVAG